MDEKILNTSCAFWLTLLDLLLMDKADNIADKEKTEWGEKQRREKHI